MRTVRATRYLTPLREGGSVPAIMEADDDGTDVTKFRGAAQGPRALVAEIIAGELGRALGLPVPRLVLIEVSPLLARSEPDPELQELLRKSAGLNVALDYLPGALNWEPPLAPPPDADLAARVVWFDAFITNVDRTVRNPNMLIWHKQLHLIDHGASLYFHHAWDGHLERAKSPFAAIAKHALLPIAAPIDPVDAELAPKITEDVLRDIVRQVPEELLDGNVVDGYVEHLLRRLEGPRAFVEEVRRVQHV
jgi:hypothetical protein